MSSKAVGTFSDPLHGKVNIIAKRGERASHAITRVRSGHAPHLDSQPMHLLLHLGRNAGLLALARALVGRTSLITGGKSFLSRGVFGVVLGRATALLNSMPAAKAAELLSLAGLLASEYKSLMTRGTSAVKLDTRLNGDMHYFKLGELFQRANPWLEKTTPILSPMFGKTGVWSIFGRGLELATSASRGGETVSAGVGPRSGSILMFDTLHDTLFARVTVATLAEKATALRSQIAEQERRMEAKRRSRAQMTRSRELERTLAAQQVAAVARASQPMITEVYNEPEYGYAEESEVAEPIYDRDVYYSLFGGSKGKGKKRRRAKQKRASAEEEVAELTEQLRALKEAERAEETETQEAEHASTLERVMRLAGSSNFPASDPEHMGLGMDAFNGGLFSADCCCSNKHTDASGYQLVSLAPTAFTGRPVYDERGPILVGGSPTGSLSSRLKRYRDWANTTGHLHPEDVLVDIVLNTEHEDCGCCKDTHDYDCTCCQHKDQHDAAFGVSGRLPAGPFFNSSWVDAKLGDLPEGTFGMVDTGKRPFAVTINRNVELPRAQVSFAHEMLHVMNDLHKLGLPHDQLHNAAVMLVGEVLPGLNALTAAAQ